MPRQISRSELEDIKRLVAPAEQSDSDRLREEKKQVSEERMKKWPDTLEAQRKRKEDLYYEKLAKAEQERLRLEKEEDATRAALRKQKIENAARIIHRQTDKIKRLASAEALSESLATRVKQIELKQRLDEEEKRWAAAFVQREKEQMKVLEARELAEIAARKEQAKLVAATQKEQLAEIRAKKLEQLREEDEQGRKIMAQAEEDKKAEISRNKLKEEMGRLNQLAVVQANLAVKELKRERQRKEEEETAKLEKYAAERDAIKERTKAQQAKIADQKQRCRNELIEVAEKRLREFTSNAAAKLDREIAAVRAAEDEKARLRAEKRAAFAKSIDESRAHQVQVRKTEKEAAVQHDRDHATRWRAYNKGADELDKQEMMAEKRAARQHQQILLNQAEERREQVAEERRLRIHQARTLADQEQIELEDFYTTAQERIQAVKEKGMNTFPLEKCVSDVFARR